MRYDRPVRELLVECCREMPEPFTMANVLVWFGRHYPDVSVNTVRTQFHTLLGRGELLVVRDARGEYRRTDGPAPARERVTDQQPAPPAPPTAPASHVVLLGCVKSKAPTPQPARSLYTSPLWHKRLSYAERAGRPWFVLSAKHGVVDPDEVIAPYDVSLRAATASYQAAWGAFVAQQLATRFALAGLVVEVHAGDPYVDAVRGPLTRLGAIVEDPVDAASMGQTLAWYDEPPIPRPAPPTQTGVEEQVADALAVLRSSTGALRIDDVLTAPADLVDRPGLYSWWVDAPGATDLSRGLGITVAPGLIYAGQAGATRSSGSTSKNTLRGRIVGMHLEGSRRMSTLRRSLSAVLDRAYGVDGGEDELTAWMYEHLAVGVWPSNDRDALGEVEVQALATLDPPLNIRHMAPSPVRQRLSELCGSSG